MLGIEIGTCAWRSNRHHRIETSMALTRFTEQPHDAQYVNLVHFVAANVRFETGTLQ